ncbi:hypothetical protein ACLOJK_004379 [Asimina triloba]
MFFFKPLANVPSFGSPTHQPTAASHRPRQHHHPADPDLPSAVRPYRPSQARTHHAQSRWVETHLAVLVILKPHVDPTPPAGARHRQPTHRAGDSLLSPTTRTISTIRLLHPSRAVPQLPLSNDGQRSDARLPSPHPPATIQPANLYTHQQINDPDSDLGSSSPM